MVNLRGRRRTLRHVALWTALLSGAAPAGGDDADDRTTAPAAEQASEQRLLALAGPGARLRRTDHFLIAYDTPERTVRSLVSRLEATYRSVYRLCKINDIPAVQPEGRLEVLFFHDYETYGRYAAACRFPHQGSAGFYDQRSNVAAFVNILNLPELGQLNRLVAQSDERIERLRAARPVNRLALKAERRKKQSITNQRNRIVERTNRLTVQHEVAHQVFFNSGVHVPGARNPGWLVEGLACLFETPPSSSGAGAGTTNQMRLADFRACLGNGDPRARLKAEDFEVALESGRLLPLRDLVGDTTLFNRRDDPNLVHYYSQAWALVFYLQRSRRAEFADYLRLLEQRKIGQDTTRASELADFESVFGPLDDDFQRRWASFIVSLRFKPSET